MSSIFAANAQPLPRAIPDGHSRSWQRSAVPAAISGVLLGGAQALQGVNPRQAAGLAALGILSTGASVGIINYTNHNGSFHDGKQWNHPLESMGIGAGIGAMASAAAISLVGRPDLMLIGAAAGAVSGSFSGVVYHYFNRPN